MAWSQTSPHTLTPCYPPSWKFLLLWCHCNIDLSVPPCFKFLYWFLGLRIVSNSRRPINVLGFKCYIWIHLLVPSSLMPNAADDCCRHYCCHPPSICKGTNHVPSTHTPCLARSSHLPAGMLLIGWFYRGGNWSQETGHTLPVNRCGCLGVRGRNWQRAQRCSASRWYLLLALTQNHSDTLLFRAGPIYWVVFEWTNESFPCGPSFCGICVSEKTRARQKLKW